MSIYIIGKTMKKIAIELSREAFIPGELVEGAVKLSIDKPVSARAVKLEIHGAEKTYIERGNGDDSHTYTETNSIIKENIILHSPLYDAQLELAPGDYVFEFDFRLPEYALPSYNGHCVDIKYELKARVDVPWWFDIKEKRQLYVFRSRSPLGLLTRPVQFQSDNYSEMNSQKPSFCAELTKTGFLAGEVIEGNVALKNMFATHIRKIYVTLLGIEFAQASGYTENLTLSKERIEIPVNGMYDGVPREFVLPTPRDCPSSYEGVYSNFRWGVEIGLDIPLAFDVKGIHPVEILR